MNKVECPNCLGEGIIYDPELEIESKCKLCKGTGKVRPEDADAYLATLLSEEDEEE